LNVAEPDAPKPLSYADRAHDYARQVTAGHIVAGKHVRQACLRHLRDLERVDSNEFGYRFNPTGANRACRFIEQLPHTKGIWAARREKLLLQGWQLFIVCSLFGWVEKDSGNYRFWEAYIEVSRKNGKSPLGAAIGLYKFAAEGEFGAEVYSGATTEKQAWEVFRPARLMCKSSPDLCKAFGIEVNAKGLYIPANGSRFEPIIGQPGDGASPSCAIVDEYHEHLTRVLYDAMKTGIVGRTNPLVLVITTAGTNLGGPCYDLHLDAQKILDGALQNDNLFAIIFSADLGDDWKSELALRKANPNYGVSVDPRKLRAAQLEAVQSAAKQNTFKTKHEDIWCNAAIAWMNLEKWNAAADPTLRLEDFLEDECITALDLASRVDLCSKVMLFRRMIEAKEHFYCFSTHYLNEAAIVENRNASYGGWVNSGYLIQTPGNITDYGKVADDMVADALRFNRLEQCAHDPYHAAALVQFIEARDDWPRQAGDEARGIPSFFVEVRQTVQNLSPAMKELEAVIVDGRFHHDGNPLMTWEMSNVVCFRDAKENIYPRKDRVENKIDGPVATMMALARWMFAEPAQYTSGNILLI
jgi:phage terminase large subunit-like protein